MKIKILVIGKTKEKWCETGENHYLERILPFADIEKIEIMEEKITASISEEEIKRREGEKIIERIPKDFYTIALSPNGKKLSSESFAELLQKVKDFEGGKLCFLIGGPLGLSVDAIKSVDMTISFSEMTFPHDLFRIMLLEQIYRSFSLIAGKKYHK